MNPSWKRCEVLINGTTQIFGPRVMASERCKCEGVADADISGGTFSHGIAHSGHVNTGWVNNFQGIQESICRLLLLVDRAPDKLAIREVSSWNWSVCHVPPTLGRIIRVRRVGGHDGVA